MPVFGHWQKYISKMFAVYMLGTWLRVSMVILEGVTKSRDADAHFVRFLDAHGRVKGLGSVRLGKGTPSQDWCWRQNCAVL